MELSQPPCPEDVVVLVEKPASAITPAASQFSERRAGFWVALAALLAAAAKATIAWNTIGTNDVITFYQFAASLQNHGLEWTYVHSFSRAVAKSKLFPCCSCRSSSFFGQSAVSLLNLLFQQRSYFWCCGRSRCLISRSPSPKTFYRTAVFGDFGA